MGKIGINYSEIKNKLEPFKDVIYYEALTEKEVLELEKKWNMRLRPLIREFLLDFGFCQDLVEELKMEEDEMWNNIKWLRENGLDNYIPIKTEIGHPAPISGDPTRPSLS